MTSTITFPAWVIGLMSGTSADGVDAALLYTDGKAVVDAGKGVFVPYGAQLRHDILQLMQGQGNEQGIGHELTEIHRQAVEKLIAEGAIGRDEIQLVGFHGQTILHKPQEGITRQIGDAPWLAEQLGMPVVYDFRTADVKAGGQGAPLVPLYHAAMAAKLEKPVMVVNIGGVANVTYIDDNEIIAFDCGPGNALIDDWLFHHTGKRYDENGERAALGRIHSEIVDQFLEHPFFSQKAPKSLDRNQFSLELVKGLSLEDGAATLTAMTSVAILEAMEAVPQLPKQLIIAGGGVHNLTLIKQLTAQPVPVLPAHALGWNGDMLEAQAFAYLAARSVQNLPLTLPGTTGVPKPQTGGVLSTPTHHHHHDDDEDNTSPRPCCR